MEEMWESSPALPLLRRLGLPLERHPAHSSVIIDGRLHTFHDELGGAAFLDGLLADGRDGFDDFRAAAQRTLATLDRGRWLVPGRARWTCDAPAWRRTSTRSA